MSGTSTANGGSFVGRRSELDAVHRVLAEPAESARLICVRGPAGIGKTTLAEQVTNASDGRTTWWTRCWDGPGTPALWPWAQLLDSMGLDTVELNADDRFQQFDSIAAALATRSKGEPITLVIDDIHWADTASLELLHFIGRDARPCDLRVIATHRPNETDAGSSVELIGAIEREAHVIELAGLSHEELVELAASTGVDSPDLIAAISQRTGGNPFFAQELLRVGEEDGRAGERLPTSVRSIVERHLALVDATTRTCLAVSAIQGRVFDPAIVAAAAALDSFDVQEMLDAARRARLVTIDEGNWSFIHALIGETLLDGLTAHDLASHHLHTAEALEKRFGGSHPDHVESITGHLRNAGNLVTPERMLDAALASSSHASQRLAWETASSHLGWAIDALQETGEPDAGQLIDTLLERCVVEKALRNTDTARSLGLRTADLARAAGDHVRFARVALEFPPDVEGIELDQVVDPDQAKLREEALAGLPADEPTLRTRLLAAHAMSLYWDSPPGGGAPHRASVARRDALTAEALATAEQLGDDETLALAIRARLYANWGPAAEPERSALAQRLHEVADRIGDARLALEGRVWRVPELMEHGKLVEAEVELDAFEADASRLRSRYHQWTAQRQRSNLVFMRGDLDEAERLNTIAFEFGSTFLGAEAAYQFYSAALGPTLFLRNSLGGLFDTFAEVARESPHIPSWRIGYALAAAELGKLDIVRAEIRALAADDFDMVPRDLDFITSVSTMSSLARRTREGEIGEQISAYLRPHAGKLVVHGVGYTSYGSYDLCLGECAHGAGDVERADHHYTRGVEQLAAVGQLYGDYAKLLHGELLTASDPTRARRLLREVIDVFDRVNAPAMVAWARRSLAQVDEVGTVRLVEGPAGWKLERHDTPPVDLAHLKGLRALRDLLVHPHEHRHVLELTSLMEGHGGSTVPSPAAADRADDTAVAAYRERATELAARLDDADRAGNSEQSDQIHAELDALTTELARVQGFGGRNALEATDADRARVNVTKHVKRAIARVAEVDSELGEHLRDTISTGMHCVYAPRRETTIHWSA